MNLLQSSGVQNSMTASFVVYFSIRFISLNCTNSSNRSLRSYKVASLEILTNNLISLEKKSDELVSRKRRFFVIPPCPIEAFTLLEYFSAFYSFMNVFLMFQRRSPSILDMLASFYLLHCATIKFRDSLISSEHSCSFSKFST